MPIWYFPTKNPSDSSPEYPAIYSIEALIILVFPTYSILCILTNISLKKIFQRVAVNYYGIIIINLTLIKPRAMQVSYLSL